MKKRVVSMFLALVVVLSFLLSISSFAYTASFSGYTNDFSIFNNHPTYGTLKLRIRQSAAFDGMYFEAKGEYWWKDRIATADQLQNHATLKIKATVISIADCVYLPDSADNQLEFYGNNITDSYSSAKTVLAYNDADSLVLSTSNTYKFRITSTIDPNFTTIQDSYTRPLYTDLR